MLGQNMKMLYAWNNISWHKKQIACIIKVVSSSVNNLSLEIFSCFVIYFELNKENSVSTFIV